MVVFALRPVALLCWADGSRQRCVDIRCWVIWGGLGQAVPGGPRAHPNGLKDPGGQETAPLNSLDGVAANALDMRVATSCSARFSYRPGVWHPQVGPTLPRVLQVS